MKSCKRFISFILIVLMIAGLSLTGHAAGYSISGTVTSYDDAVAMTVLRLFPEGGTVAIITQTVTGNQATYQLANVPYGSYTMTVQKEGHVTRTYPVTIDSTDAYLDVKVCPLGDVSGNGKVNMGDVSTAYAHSKRTALLTDSYKLACGDLNGDGKVNLGDTSKIYAISKGSYKPAVKEVTLSVWTPANDQFDDNNWLAQMQASFEQAHPEYKITWENGICHEGDAGRYVTEDPANAADVYMIANDQIGTLINAGAIQKLDKKYADQVLTDNSQAMINTVTYIDGNVYAFPMTNNNWFMYYNKKTYTEEDVKSLDTMLTKGNVAFQWGTAWYSGTFFLANGGTIFGDKGIDASAGIQFGKDNGGYEAALKMVQLASNQHLINDIDGRGFQGFRDGSVDAYFSGSWDYQSLLDALGDNLGIAQLPTVEIGGVRKQMKAFVGSKAVAVNPHADELELATAFAAHLATPDAQKLRYEYNSTIPAAASLINDPVISHDPVAKAEINNITNASNVQPIIPEMNNYWTPIGNFGGKIASGEINEANYMMYVDQLLAELNDGIIDDDTVTLSVWAPDQDLTDGGWMEVMQKAFAADHPELNIIWNNSACSEGDAGSMVSSDPINAADVYMFANDQLGTLVDAGAITELTDNYLDQVTAYNSQTLINTVTHTDGGIYGFPVSNNTWFMYYNKDVFSEEDIKSLDTMLEKGRVAFPMSNSWYSGTFFLANGGTLFGDKGIDSSAGIQFGKNNGGYEAAMKMLQLADDPNFIPDEYGIGSQGMCDGSVDAYFSGSWDYPGLYSMIGDKLGVAQLPTVEINGVQKQMKSFAGSKAVAVNPYAENHDLAIAFAAFISTPDAQMLRYMKRGVIPCAESLVNEWVIQENPVALAEINTMNNTSVVQPCIPEMANYWTPMGEFTGSILNGNVHEGNYQQAVDHLMLQFNGEESRITNIRYSYGDLGDGVTLRVHYYRPDANYDGWNLWLWDGSEVETTFFEAPYQFENVNGEMVCTVEVEPATNQVGYIVRYLDWVDKDIHEDQFIDITGIIDGTLDVYIQSGVKGHTIILNDDVISGVAFQSLTYSHDSQNLVLALSSVPNGNLNAELTDSNGQVTISHVARIGSYFYLTLAEPLTPGSYSLSYNTGTVLFDII